MQLEPLGEKRVPHRISVGQYPYRQRQLVEVDISDGSRKGVKLPQFWSPLSVPGGLRQGWLSGEACPCENTQPTNACDCCEALSSVALAPHNRAPKCH